MADFNTRPGQSPATGRDDGREGKNQRNSKVGAAPAGATVVRDVPRLVRSTP